MISKKLSLAIFVMFLVTALFSVNSLLADNNTVLYLQGEGTTIKDTSGKNYQVTVYGNTAISTTQKKFGNSSIYFDGSGDYLQLADSNDWYFEAGDFTIDFWVRWDNLEYRGIFGQSENATNGPFFYLNLYNDKLNFEHYSGSVSGSFIGTVMGLVVNQWYHIAIVKYNNIVTFYRNGVNVGSHSNTVNYNQNAPFTIGRDNYRPDFKGYIDEFRITKGQALWTASFIPPAPTPTVNFSTSKDLINYGESVTLNWSTLDASGCTLQYNNTTQVLDLTGTLNVTPSAPTTYTLIANGPGGTTYKELNVKVLNGYSANGPFTVATKVGIGVMNPQNALEVNGTIKAKEVQVTLSGWADYVFSTDYDLRSLAELEAFIQKNKRLPEMPSAEQLEQQGISVTEILKKQMQKIEELTLYILQLQKQIEELKKE